MRDIVLPAGDRPWALSPTPMPELPKELKMGVVAKAVKQAQQVMMTMAQQSGVVMERSEFRQTVAELGDKLRDDAERELMKVATKRAKRMEDRIADRLVQGGWEEAMDGFIENFVTFPAAILKGPVYRRRRTLTWGDGWTPMVSDNPAQSWEVVSTFDAYPAVGAKDCQHGDFIERERYFREDLHALKGLPGYHDDQIEQALLEYTNGHLEGWLWTEAERLRLEQETTYLFLSPPGVIDAINFWGRVQGWKLMSWGVNESLEPDRDYEINCVLVGRFVIYCAMNPDPMMTRPYHKACYDEIPGAFWGRCPPDLCAVHQQMCNAIACSLADNLGWSSGPMGWVHADRLADGENSLEWAPGKLWQLKSDATQGVNPGIGILTVVDNSASLMNTYGQWEQRADDATGIPRYTYGNGEAAGAGDTASGLSMLMSNAAKGLRRAISNIDMRVIQPTITQAFVNEMLYNPDHSIKGDCTIVPRGAAAILIKEAAQQRRMQALGLTANPIDMQIIGAKGRAELLREVFSSLELPVDDIVPTNEEMDQQQQQQAEQQQQQLQQQMQIQAAQQDKQTEQKLAVVQAQATAKSQGAQQENSVKMITDIVQQAVAHAFAAKSEDARAAAALTPASM